MTRLLEKAIAELNQLPEPRQEAMAQWILDELADDLRWQQTLQETLPQLDQLAQQALQDHQSAQTQVLKPDDLP